MRSGALILAAVASLLAGCKKPVAVSPPEGSGVLQTIQGLTAAGETLRAVPFPVVVEGSTGKEVLPISKGDAVADKIVQVISKCIIETIDRLNQADSPVRRLRRINEASRFFEDDLLERLSASGEFTCELPQTAAGKAQRSGYPDLKITHIPSGRVAYLDPKLFERGSRKSSLRTFYFEPKTETNKILDDAHHLLIGIEHDGNNGAWQFTNWHIVDLSKLVVRLKPEFQASNRDIYGDNAILQSGEDDLSQGSTPGSAK